MNVSSCTFRYYKFCGRHPRKPLNVRSSLSFKASDYEAKVRKEAAAFELSSLPEDLRRQMKQLTYKQLEREELAELSAAISGTEIAQN